MKPWRRVKPTVVTKVGYRTVLVKHFQMPDGRTVDWTIMNEDGWAAANAIVVTVDNKVVIARQFRPGPERILDELPGGIVDPRETPEEAVLREVAEEVGYRPATVEYLGSCHYDAYVNGDRHYFLFTGCISTKEGAQPGDDESIEVRLVSIDELLQIAKDGCMTDPGAVLMAYDKLKEMMNGKSD